MAASAPAFATEVPGLTLEWSAPPDCPSGQQVEASIARQLGGAKAEPPLTVTALVSVQNGTWQVELGNGQGGARTLTGQTCRAVASAAVVVVALMIDPLAVTEATPVIEEAAPPRPIFFGVWGGGDLSTLPKLSPGLAVHFGVALAAGFSLEIHAQGFLPQVTTQTPGATVTLFGGALGARRDFEAGPFFFAPLLALEAGALRGRSFGVSDPALNHAFWLAGRAGVALGLRFGVVRVGLRAEAVVPITRPRFIAEGVGELYTPPFISGRGGVTLELHFPPRSEAATATEPPR